VITISVCMCIAGEITIFPILHYFSIFCKFVVGATLVVV